MQSEILKYANLRVYKGLTTVGLLNAMLCNRIMKRPFLVNNSRKMYEISTKILGKKFVNSILTATFCKVLTAGNSLKQANRVSDYFRNHSNNIFYFKTFLLFQITVLRDHSIMSLDKAYFNIIQLYSLNQLRLFSAKRMK